MKPEFRRIVDDCILQLVSTDDPTQQLELIQTLQQLFLFNCTFSLEAPLMERRTAIREIHEQWTAVRSYTYVAFVDWPDDCMEQVSSKSPNPENLPELDIGLIISSPPHIGLASLKLRLTRKCPEGPLLTVNEEAQRAGAAVNELTGIPV